MNCLSAAADETFSKTLAAVLRFVRLCVCVDVRARALSFSVCCASDAIAGGRTQISEILIGFGGKGENYASRHMRVRVGTREIHYA